MKKLLLIMICMIAINATAQLEIENPEEAVVYEIEPDGYKIEKVVTEEMVTTTVITLADIQLQIDNLNKGIEANKAQILYFQDLIDKLEAEYAYLKELGAKEEGKEGEKGK